MALINPTVSGLGASIVTPSILSASDEFIFKSGSRQLIKINNITAGQLVVNFSGDEAQTMACPGLGSTTDLSAGFNMTIEAGEVAILAPETIALYLKSSTNTPTITGGDGAEMYLFEIL